MQHRAGREHFGVEQGPARQQAMEEPAVPVRPFHHRRDTKSAGPTFWLYFRIFSHLTNFLLVSCHTIFG
jgi:hypothetical protein